MASTSHSEIDLTESVAGEEDPGASIELATRPGDQARPGTPGTGEAVCPACGGSGKRGVSDCPECQGTGKITAGIGGG
jgi:DnaJ-class molecular chaperone